jgi:hypothetical protein
MDKVLLERLESEYFQECLQPHENIHLELKCILIDSGFEQLKIDEVL